MGSYLSLPILLVVAALQASVVPQIRLLGGGPDLVFLAVFVWAVLAPLDEAVVWAVVGGILQDLLSVAPTGMSAVGLVLMVFIVNLAAMQVYQVGLVLSLGLLLLGTLVQQLSTLILLWLTGYPIDWLSDFAYIVLPTVLYNLIFIGPVYLFLRRIQRRTSGRRLFFS